MKSQTIIRAALAAVMLLPGGFVTIASAQDLDRDRDQLKTQLAESRQLHAQLADALVSQVMA